MNIKIGKFELSFDPITLIIVLLIVCGMFARIYGN